MVLKVMEMRGADGRGADGALGWLADVDKNHKHLFVSLLKRMLPVQIRADLDPNSLMAKLLQTAAAQRSVQANGGNVIDLAPLRPSQRRYDVTEKYAGEYVEDADDR
jgi:hypothetical protein